MEFAEKINGRTFNKVSIQLLFRWNEKGAEVAILGEIKFQYNCCFGGIEDNELGYCQACKFQYNCCFGGINRRF